MSDPNLPRPRAAPEQPRAREQAEHRASEERFRVLVASVKDYGIFMLDPGGHVVSWNKGAERIKGWQEDEILGQHFSRFYTEPDRARKHPDHELELAIRNGTYQEEGWRVRKDGSRFWASVVITALFDEAGALSGFAKVTRDMTERRQHEQALAEKAAALERANAQLAAQHSELEARNAEQETFVYTVSHDLRAPLLSIGGMGELLVEALRGGDPEEAAFLVGRITANVDKMHALLGDLLTLSRAGRHTEDPEPLDLGEMTASVLAELDARVRDRHLRLELPDRWPTIVYGRTDAYQVLANLLSNAAKFAGRPGEEPKLRLSWTREADLLVTLRVEDNGPGVPEAFREKVFGLFQRLNPRAEGTGVGLTIVKRIAERYGGRVWVEASPPAPAGLGGAAFLVTMPSSGGG